MNIFSRVRRTLAGLGVRQQLFGAFSLLLLLTSLLGAASLLGLVASAAKHMPWPASG